MLSVKIRALSQLTVSAQNTVLGKLNTLSQANLEHNLKTAPHNLANSFSFRLLKVDWKHCLILTQTFLSGHWIPSENNAFCETDNTVSGITTPLSAQRDLGSKAKLGTQSQESPHLYLHRDPCSQVKLRTQSQESAHLSICTERLLFSFLPRFESCVLSASHSNRVACWNAEQAIDHTRDLFMISIMV